MKMNITSGQFLNDKIKNRINEPCIPFNEAMIEGNPKLPIFDSLFIEERCLTHHCTNDEYKKNMHKFLNFIKDIHQYPSIHLWFGCDMFCQLNLLTILAYLKQENYCGEINLVFIDEENDDEIVDIQNKIPLTDYLDVYNAVFIERQPINANSEYLNKAILDYLNIQNKTASFILFIQQNHDKMSKQELYDTVWKMTRKYGLGDIQVKQFIKEGVLTNEKEEV